VNSAESIVSKYKSGILLAILLVFSMITMSVSSNEVSLKPSELGLSILSAFQRSFAAVGDRVASTVNSVRELGLLQTEYRELLNRIRMYEGLEKDIQELQREMTMLREQLGFSESLNISHIPAQVIGKDPGNYFTTITINRGTRNGVRRDMPVIAVQEGTEGLVGRVEYAGTTTSIIKPILDSSSSVAARLQRSRHDGLVTGGGIGSNRVVMRYVPEGARNEIAYDDRVITSGLSSVFPAGLIIGRVTSIQARSWETSLELYLEPVIDFSRLEYVFVVDQR
jgi:rod shape-determining protein MreC